MKVRIKQTENVSHVIQSKTKASRQAPIEQILQRYTFSVENGKVKGETVVQREAISDEDERLQAKFESVENGKVKGGSLQRQENLLSPFNSHLSPNKTGLPDDLKSGIENLSGYSMDDVRVHYNSNKPTQLQALAYTQGTDIHVAPGQEKHLPHEAWHVVQQKQGRVQPTMQIQGVNVNDDEGLEKEADVMRGMMVQLSNKNLIQKKVNCGLNSNVVQGIFNIVNLNIPANIHLRPQDNNKLNRLQQTLMNMHNANPNNEGTIDINVQDSGFLTTNPADTRIAALLAGLPTYEINIEHFYIKMSSYGEIVGLIAHELGVHCLADVQTQQNVNLPLIGGGMMNVPLPPGVPGGLVPPGIPGALVAQDVLPVQGPVAPGAAPLGQFNSQIPGFPTNYTLNPNTARQVDHINAVDFSPGAIKARAQNYLNTFLEIGDAMQPAPVAPADYADLVKTFTFDIARILATNDGGMLSVGTNTGRIATAMNDFFAYIVANYGVAHPWLNIPNIYQQQTGISIFAYLLGKAIHGFVRNIF